MVKPPTGSADAIRMEAEQILAGMRGATIVVGRDGTVEAAHGEVWETAGRDAHQIVGANAIDFVAPEFHDVLIEAFSPFDKPDASVLRKPLPFSLELIGERGERRAVDVYPTGLGDRWIALAVPRRLNPGVLDIVDLVLDGADLPTIARAVVERNHEMHHPEDGRLSSHVITDVGTEGCLLYTSDAADE